MKNQSFRVFKDGNQWCAVGPHFRDLRQDAAGFGDTVEDAIAKLLNNGSFKTWLNRMNLAEPEVRDFEVQ